MAAGRVERRAMVARALLVVLGAALVVLLAPQAADAHASLESTDPIGGAVLKAAPKQVSLTFSESVVTSADSIQLFDGNGDRLDTSRPAHLNGDAATVGVDVSKTLDKGAYIVTWRVISADSHPVHGAFTFRVGAGSGGDTQAVLAQLVAAGRGSKSVSVAYGIVRFAAFAALVVLLGGAAFVLTLWPRGVERARRMLGAAWIVAVVTTVLGICLQGVYATARPLGDVVRWSVIADVFGTRFGQAWALRLLLLLIAAPLLVVAGRNAERRRPALLGALGLLGVALLVTPGLAGHPGADHPAALTVAADTLHLVSVSLWLGGLTVLSLLVLRRPSTVDATEAHDDAVDAVQGFSRVALVAVIAILVTGLFQGWRQSGSIAAITHTDYGRLLIIKFGLFSGMVALAAMSRVWVRRRLAVDGTDPDAAPPISRLRQSVAGEALIAVVILAVTAVLVETVPAKSALAQPFSTELHTEQVLIDVTVDPAKAGPVDLHVYTLTHQGAVQDVAEFTADLSLPGRDIGPLEVPLERAGPGHFVASGFDVPLPGLWQLELKARTSDIHEETATTQVRIR